jgi:hypothetical protein
MGWYPAREKDNTVSEANLYFPNKKSDPFPTPFSRIKRWGPPKENQKWPRSWQKQIVDHAMAMGFYNGERLAKR